MRWISWIGALSFFATAARADPFADFRIPDHTTRWAELWTGAWGSWNGAGSPLYEIRESTVRTYLNGSLGYFKDSDRLQYSFDTTIQTNAARGDSRLQQGSTPQQRRSSRDERIQQQATLGASLRAYPWSPPLGIELTVSGRHEFSHLWSGYNARYPQDPPGNYLDEHVRFAHRSRIRRVEFAVAPGWGRVRDATVAFDVHVLEERLTASGVLAQPLSPATRERLAALFYVRSDFAVPHERPNRFFWREVERVLAEDGDLGAQGLDAYGLLYSLDRLAPDPAFELITWRTFFQRLRGSFVGPVVLGEHGRVIRNSDSNTSTTAFVADSVVSSSGYAVASRVDGSFDSYHAGGRIECHRPVGWNWQLSGRSQVTVPIRAGEDGFRFQSQARADWFITDRWHWNAGVDHQRRVLEPRSSQAAHIDAWQIKLGTGIAYFLEDRTTVSASLSQSQNGSKDRGDHQWRRETVLELGLRYRFMGALNAPGLIEPQHFID